MTIAIVASSRLGRPHPGSLGVLAATTLLLAFSGPAGAQSYTSRSAFLAALPGPANTINFDAVPSGTTIASGTGTGGITVTYNFGGVLLKVTGAYPTVSGANALGSTDADVLQDGDNLTATFANRNAIGLEIITKEALQNGDLTLSAGGQTATLSAGAIVQTLTDGSNVYFLGVIRPATAFTTATLTTVGGGYFLYNVDDITTAVTQDTDGDGVPDPQDNCKLVANPTQLDADGDGYGNACDADLNNSGLVTAADFAIMRSVLGQSATANPTAAAADLNGSGTVTAADFAILRAALGSNPGPSGLHPNCPPTCP
jgi:hypothetical protein